MFDDFKCSFKSLQDSREQQEVFYVCSIAWFHHTKNVCMKNSEQKFMDKHTLHSFKTELCNVSFNNSICKITNTLFEYY